MVDSKKLEDILKFLIVGVLVILANELASRYFYRLDLTEEKRYTLSDATRNLLNDLDDVVFVEVYLEGTLPAGFERFRNTIQETLEQFRAYGGANIRYRFIDPEQAMSAQARNEFINRLGEKGIQPTNVYANQDGQRIEKLVFPGALVYYQGRETGVMLLKGNQGASSQEILNQSIEGIEFELASAIRDLSAGDRKRIALIKGQGELDSLEIAGLESALRERYLLADVRLPEEGLAGFDAAVIAKPTQPFTERSKYIIDQYLMQGGKLVFLIDAVDIHMDSVRAEGALATAFNLNLDDMLFQYGARINPVLIQDLNAALYPVVVGRMGDQPQIRPMPWPFFPLINDYADHPVVRNLDAIILKFANTIDTVKADGIKKTPLLFTSQYTRTTQAPAFVSLNEMRSGLNPEQFTRSGLPVAYLLEGSFTSLYKNRILPPFARQSTFVEEGTQSAILICADGDVARNDVSRQNGRPYPLGFDPVTQTTLANADFILNALSYLVDQDGLILARNKEVVMRPLNKVKLEEEKVFWQFINLGLPLAALILFGVVKFYLRKRKYSRF